MCVCVCVCVYPVHMYTWAPVEIGSDQHSTITGAVDRHGHCLCIGVAIWKEGMNMRLIHQISSVETDLFSQTV